jgi:hypothetical protein
MKRTLLYAAIAVVVLALAGFVFSFVDCEAEAAGVGVSLGGSYDWRGNEFAEPNAPGGGLGLSYYTGPWIGEANFTGGFGSAVSYLSLSRQATVDSLGFYGGLGLGAFHDSGESDFGVAALLGYVVPLESGRKVKVGARAVYLPELKDVVFGLEFKFLLHITEIGELEGGADN